MIFGKLICYFRGHLRGRRLEMVEFTFSEPGIVQLQCPRCGTRWMRKERKPRAKP